jgi:hypothetical protein
MNFAHDILKFLLENGVFLPLTWRITASTLLSTIAQVLNGPMTSTFFEKNFYLSTNTETSHGSDALIVTYISPVLLLSLATT